MEEHFLFMILLGSKAPSRNVEQHDFFFGIARNLKELVPAMRAFWPEAGKSLHIDGWRKITAVEGYRINIISNTGEYAGKRVFFINLGGYCSGRLEEQHYTMLTVQDDRLSALSASKRTEFFRTATIAKVKGANAHIDEKYGIDVDEIYRVDELLSEQDKQEWHISLNQEQGIQPDEIHLGYLQLHQL
ncbi:DUF1543 domain-containing protein [Mucilaginibacter segetis]|uniref:DUF1543 domain-containing protein n=1 Tax=Mucilaginibacter segetis TaxID=2793071 RepID=A0A934ULE1_9SPHI|nr:DUF1543 domain-containing protein [Mucilaginibacter segetis]MBK0378458.1 DUF1543 domain-containing protein [Mucilaginibacter segetis]